MAIPAWQLVWDGPFSWHIAQPAFWQGGLEALALMVLLASAQLLRQPVGRILASSLLIELYLRRHGVDAAVLVDLVYLELVFGLGVAVMRSCGASPPDSVAAYLRCFVLGFCVWSACAWGISALGYGSTHELRWLSALLLIVVPAARPRPWSLFVAQRVFRFSPGARMLSAVLLAWLLVLYAHSATAVGYDGLWYGLRGDRVLVGAGTVFAPQGLVAPVYYFPKVYELFLVPLSGLGSSSVVAGMSVMLAGLLAAAAYQILARIGMYARFARLLGALLVVSLPAVANSALDPKPDLLAALLLIVAWSNAADFLASRRRTALLWTLSATALAVNAKLTAIPFAGGLVIAVLLAALRQKPAPESSAAAPALRAERRVAWSATILALTVCVFVTARTWLLSGMPTIGPDPLFKLWQWFGFSLRFPVGTGRWSFPTQWSEIPTLVLDLLFRPQKLEHIQIAWVGNGWIWLAVVLLMAIALAPGPRPSAPRASETSPGTLAAWPGIGLMLVGFGLMLGWGYQIRGGDGNYFIAGLVPAILLLLTSVWFRLKASSFLAGILSILIGAFCVFQGAYSLMSANWSPGTRAFDLDFARSPRELAQQSAELFRANGLANIATYLRAKPNWPALVGCTGEENTLGMRLPARFEDVAWISYAHRDFTDDRGHFIAFLAASHVGYLLVPRPDNTSVSCLAGHALFDAVADLNSKGQTPAVHDDGYDLYDISAGWPR